MVNPKYEHALRKILDNDEKLIWAGKPNVWRIALKPQALSGPFIALLIMGLTGFIAYQSIQNPLNEDEGIKVAIALGVIFGAFAIFLALFPLYYYIAAKRILYAITSKRLIIIKPLIIRTKTQTFTRPEIQMLQVKEKANGSGDLYFQSAAMGTAYNAQPVLTGFEGIADVQNVKRTIMKTFNITEADLSPFGNNQPFMGQGNPFNM